MIDELTLRRLVHATYGSRIQEIGLFRAPLADLAGPVIQGGLPEGEDFAISDEWFSEVDLEEHFSDEPRITAILPGGRVKRLDVEPRILVFEDLPAPSESHGYVARAGDNRWVMDSRDKAAVLVLADGNNDLVLWGESGNLRAFLLRPDTAA